MSKYKEIETGHECEAFQLTYDQAIGKEKVPLWFSERVESGDIQVFVTEKIHDSQYCVLKIGSDMVKVCPESFIVFKYNHVTAMGYATFNEKHILVSQ